ncbi:MAG: extracellular solute-binding protein [Rhodocyclaceae bacterium]|nr:extracellular solute-binding protein [Rhodocyclaceae bacterium]
MSGPVARVVLAGLWWLLSPCAALSAGDTLRVLAWPGYADADLVAAFEQRSGVRVEVTLVDSDEALWQKVSDHDAADFDVFAVNTAELRRYIRSGWVVPIDTRAIPNLSRQMPRFRALDQIPGIVHAGRPYAIPYTYAEMGLIYDRSQFSTPPDSIEALWEPGLRRRVLAYNGGVHSFSLAALALGSDHPFDVRDDDWTQLAQKLIDLRRNVLTFYTLPDESVQLFREKRVALLFANYGSQQVQLLKRAGVDVGYAIPREGALAWLDCWAITRGARDVPLAHAWIDYFLEEGPSAALTTRQGLANTTATPSGSESQRLIWLEPVEDAERRNRLWARILSGDNLKRVMQP